MSSRSAMIQACSACGGDYEDPDRTAATDPEGDDMIVDDHETGASKLAADGEDEAGGESVTAACTPSFRSTFPGTKRPLSAAPSQTANSETT